MLKLEFREMWKTYLIASALSKAGIKVTLRDTVLRVYTTEQHNYRVIHTLIKQAIEG